MTKFNKPLNEILMEDYLPSLKGNDTFTKQQFVDWLEDYYPGFADSTVTNWLTRLSTNLEGRLNWAIRKQKDDVLFKLEKVNTFRLFDQKVDPPPKYFKFSRIMRRCGQLGIPYKTVIESPYAMSEGRKNGEVQYQDGKNGTVGWGDKKEQISGKHTAPYSFEEMLNFLGLYYDRLSNQYHHQNQDLSPSSSNILKNDKQLARHFLVYWKPEQISKVLKEGRLSKAASNQFNTIKPGDTLWICGYNKNNTLVTVGYILVDEIIGQDEANRRFPELKWEAKFHACAQVGKEISTREVSLESIMSELSFISNLSTHLDLKNPLGNQLQRKRELSIESSQLLIKLWNEFDLSCSVQPATFQKIVSAESMTAEKNKSGKELSRLEIVKILNDKFGFSVRKGNRSEGGGIVASKKSKTYNVKFSYSRSYFNFIKEEVICSGWHTLFENEIESETFNFFIFVVEGIKSDFHYFVFKREDIPKEFDYKPYDANMKRHFYFRVKNDGKPVELRDKIENDMSAFYNNWDVFFSTEATTPVAVDIDEPTIPERSLIATYRILRDTVLARRIKEDEDYVCQLCSVRITLGNGQPYAEAHHVKPLGKPHEGPDTPDNIVCVCPNCHVKLDYGAVTLSADFTSKIRKEFINYHNQHIFAA